MVRSSALTGACRDLFTHYPTAVIDDDHNEAVRTMLLALHESDSARYFVLSQACHEDMAPYSLRLRRTTEVTDIGAADGDVVPDVVINAITNGVPVPQDGSLFGWVSGGSVAALIATYTTSTPSSPDPFWVAMPRTDTPESQWPPFADERFLGQWFWEHYRAGRIVSLDDLIAGNPETVFWANSKAAMGSNSCAVAHDIVSPKGYTVPRGIYMHYQALRAGKPVPSLKALLADPGKTDLAPRFRELKSDGD